MSEVNDVTQHMALPLPHPENDLEDDVLRLRDALSAVDNELHSLRGLVEAAASTEALMAAIDTLGNAVAGVAELAEGKVSTVNGQSGVDITLLPEHLRMGPAQGASAMAIERDGQGRTWRVTTTLNGMPAVQTIVYTEGGAVQTITTTYKGRTRVETYSYAAGVFAGMSAEETP